MSTAPAVDTYVSAALAPLRTLARALTRLGRAVRRRPIVGHRVGGAALGESA